MTTPVTQLDFDQIKSDIISFIKNDPTFSDYNFTGSALNTIVDILAYNTHSMAYYANMLHSEGFIDTAQKRASVVSKSKELGYTPKSVIGSTAIVDITLDSIPTSSAFFTLPRGSAFSGTNSLGSYSFLTDQDYYSTLVGSTHKFSNVKIIAGARVSNTFVVDTTSNIRSLFKIPSKYVDTSTLKVYIRESGSSLTRTEYTLGSNLFTLTPTSNSYFIQESFSGYFEIYFGQNLLGIQPVNGNVIEIDYFVCPDLSDPDDCTNFYFSGSVDSASVTNITTTQRSFGGSDKEDINSIKSNAVRVNAAKNRSVTSADYETLIKSNFSFVKSVSVWGGENNVPPIYGKVFISLQPISGYTISDSVKNSVILPEIKKTSVVSIIPVFVDPDYTILEISTTIKFNETKTVSNKLDVSANIKSTVSDYVSSVSAFGLDYLESELLSSIMSIDPGVVSVSISKRIGLKLTPFINVSTRFSKSVNNGLAPGSIISSKFNIISGTGSKTVYIKEIPNSGSTTVNLGLYDLTDTLVSTIGTVNLETGTFDITFSVLSYLTSFRFINLTGSPVSDDIITKNNQIVIIDNVPEDLESDIIQNNVVTMVSYGK